MVMLMPSSRSPMQLLQKVSRSDGRAMELRVSAFHVIVCEMSP
jgi:hypothetical protein